jgi:glycosyltransferase involved in cell wall biosynthesis
MPPTSTGPFVSIITVSLNAAETIGDTLASVARQEGGIEVEHVCVDGGSRDATRSIIDAAAAESGRILRVYEPDQGIYDAMNKGWRAATGEYILYLNADDFLCAPDILRICLQDLRRGAPANPDLIVGDVAMGSLGRTGVWRHRRVPRLLTSIARSGLFPVHQGRFVQRRLIEQVGGFDARMRLAADVTQFYDMERLRPLSIRRVPRDLAFMRAGGAANGSLAAMWLGTRELYAHLRTTDPALRAGAMTVMKTLQSLSEVRYGRCPHARWFAA